MPKDSEKNSSIALEKDGLVGCWAFHIQYSRQLNVLWTSVSNDRTSQWIKYTPIFYLLSVGYYKATLIAKKMFQAYMFLGTKYTLRSQIVLDQL